MQTFFDVKLEPIGSDWEPDAEKRAKRREAVVRVALNELKQHVGGALGKYSFGNTPALRIDNTVTIRVYTPDRFTHDVYVEVDPSYSRFYGAGRDYRRRKRSFKCPVNIAKLKAHVELMRQVVAGEAQRAAEQDAARDAAHKAKKVAERRFAATVKRRAVPAALVELFDVRAADNFEVKLSYMTPQAAEALAVLLTPWWLNHMDKPADAEADE